MSEALAIPTRMSAPPPKESPTPRVKPLEWQEIRTRPIETDPEVIGWEAESILGYYTVYIGHDDFRVSLGGFLHTELGRYSSEYAARAAAQKHYDQRIRSALAEPARSNP